jgi:hypothetical protein
MRKLPNNSLQRASTRTNVVKLAIIEPGHYHGDGSYGFSESGLRLPFECTFRAEVMPAVLVLEGRARQHSGRPEYSFKLQLDRDPQSQSQADATVSIATIPSLKGRMSLTGPTNELLASDPGTQNQLSARIVPLDKPRIYELSGFLALGGKLWFPFHFRVVPTESHAAL